MQYKHVSTCPRCGAPIYEGLSRFREDGILMEEPVAFFTCECRKALPAPLPDLDGSALETTSQADRRTLARSRVKDGEPDSEDRAE